MDMTVPESRCNGVARAIQKLRIVRNLDLRFRADRGYLVGVDDHYAIAYSVFIWAGIYGCADQRQPATANPGCIHWCQSTEPKPIEASFLAAIVTMPLGD